MSIPHLFSKPHLNQIFHSEHEFEGISFQDVCYLATQSCGVSAAVIILFVDDHQKIQASYGLDRKRELHWNHEAVANNFYSSSQQLELLVHPFSCGEVIFTYMAGFKIYGPDHAPVGFLCVLDDVITKLNPAQSKSLKILSEQISSSLSSVNLHIYRDLIENVKDIIYELDGKGNYITVNSRLALFSGYAQEELLQMNYQQVVHPDDVENVKRYHRKIVSMNHRSGYQEFRITSKTGEEMWIGQNVTFQYENGELTRVRAVARDISDLVSLRKQLEESMNLYKLVAENSRDLTCLTKLDGTFLYVSPYSKELLGYEPEELVGTNGYSYFHPDDLNEIKREARFQNSFLSSAQYRFRKKDGTYVWVETVNKKVYENGEAVSFQSNTRNISKRKEIQKQLERNSAILSSMMENTRDFIFALDKKQRFIYFNSRYRDIYERRTGQPPEIGSDYIFDPAQKEHYLEIFRKVIDGERVQVDIKYPYTPNEYTHFEGYFNPITDSNGRPIGGAAFLRDVTDQKA